MELINRYKYPLTLNYHSYDGEIQYVSIPFKFLNTCPNIHYLRSLLKYKNMHGYNVVDDYLLAWFHENLTRKSMKKLSNDLVNKKKIYSGLWELKNILCNGVLTDLVENATSLPHGWIWVEIPNKPHMRILKFLYTDENFYKIDRNYVNKDVTYVFYNGGNKICEIKEAEKREPYIETVAKELGLLANDRNVKKFINRSIKKAKSDKTFDIIPAFKIDGVDNKMKVQKKTSGINFIRKTKTTEEFWDVYLKKEGIPNKVFDIEGYRLFCTGFPRPFIPLIIDNNSWVRVFESIPHRYDTQIYDLWILQSDLKEFYKYIINAGKGIALVEECLALHNSQRVRASNILQKFYKKNNNIPKRVRASNKRQFNYPTYITTNNSIKNLTKDRIEEESESEQEWEKLLEDSSSEDEEEKYIKKEKYDPFKKERIEEEEKLKELKEYLISLQEERLRLVTTRTELLLNRRIHTLKSDDSKVGHWMYWFLKHYYDEYPEERKTDSDLDIDFRFNTWFRVIPGWKMNTLQKVRHMGNERHGTTTYTTGDIVRTPPNEMEPIEKKTRAKLLTASNASKDKVKEYFVYKWNQIKPVVEKKIKSINEKIKKTEKEIEYSKKRIKMLNT